MKPGKKIATWHNDGTPQGRWEWEPGYGPEEEKRRAGRELVVLLVAFAVIWLTARVTLGSEPQRFEVVNKTPAFTVVNKVPPVVAPVPAPVDPRGVWSPVWDGYQWQPRWVGGTEVKPAAARPFPAATTPDTVVQTVRQRSTAWPGSTVTAPTPTYVLGAGRVGGTEHCPPSG